MNRIELKELKLLNFKGIRDMRIDFNSNETKISGRNGTGKSTIADAFIWLLFGKDLQDRESFDYKTLDKEGRIIPHLPHEVSGIILYNGKEIRLTRKVVEKWEKRGDSEVFNGNTIERYWNDVPCSDKEFKLKINEICPETVFKYITNPMYFTAQKPELQKKMLIEMAGKINDSEIARGNKDFEEFLRLLEGKTEEELKKEIGAKKNRIKSEMEGMADRIDENKRSMPADEDWVDLQKEIDKKNNEIDKLDRQIEDISQRKQENDKTIIEAYSKISSLRDLISKREQFLHKQINSDYEKKLTSWNSLHQELLIKKSDIKAFDALIKKNISEIELLSNEKDGLLKRYKQLLQSIDDTTNEKLYFNDSDFKCPTCGRILEDEDIEERKKILISNFKENQQKKIAELNKEIAQNLSKGTALKETILQLTKANEEFYKKKEITENECSQIESLPEFKEAPKAPEKVTHNDIQIRSWQKEIDILQNKLNEPASGNEEIKNLNAERKRIAIELDNLKNTIRKKEDKDAKEARIAELEDQYTTLSSQLMEQTRIETIIADFNKARNLEIQKRIEKLFEIVKFKWVKQQVNGAEKETCEASINGVPYNMLNHAAKLDAGLDIINAICNNKQITAPIIIDNAESCNSFRPTIGQKILLEVTLDNSLQIN